MLSMCVTILQQGRDVTLADKVTGHRKVWSVGRDGALLFE